MYLAILKDADGIEQDRRASDDWDTLMLLVEVFLFAAVRPSDTIEFTEEDA